MKHIVVAGMPRSGTTYLYHNLQRHPQFYLPFRKEIHYFSINFDLGEQWYRGHFQGINPETQTAVDISPGYFQSAGTENRIIDFSNETLVVLIVRDPLEWALSLHAQFGSLDKHLPDFREFVEGYEFMRGGKTMHYEFQNNFVPRRISQFCDACGDRLTIAHYRMLRRQPLQFLRLFETLAGTAPFFTEANFDSRKINASGRRNIRWLSRLLTDERLISSIGRFGSRRVTQILRRWMDGLGGVNAGKSHVSHDEKDVALSRQLFAAQQAWIDALFVGRDVVTSADVMRMKAAEG